MKGLYFDLKMWKIILTKIHLAPKFLNFIYKDSWAIPEPLRENEVLIKTLQAGICGSDIHQIKLDFSYYASVLTNSNDLSPLGHEVVGLVEKTSENSKFRKGDRVILNPSIHCKSLGISPCPSCEKGDRQHCYILVGKNNSDQKEIEKRSIGINSGGFSEYFLAYENNLHKVPENVPNHVAVLIEPFAIGLHAVLRNPPSDSDSVIVFGAGTIGLMIVAAIRALGKKTHITCIARHKHQAEAARILGADEIVFDIKDKTQMYKAIAKKHNSVLVTPLMRKPYAFGVNGPDIIYDSVASEATIEDSLHVIRAGGKMVLVGIGISITKHVDWAVQIFKEVTIVGAFLQSISEYGGKIIHPFEFGLKYMSENVALFEKIVTHRFPLQKYKEAFHAFQNKSNSEAIKVVFDYT